MPRILKWKRRPDFSTAPEIHSISVTRARLGTSVTVTITGRGFRNCANGTPPIVKFGDLFATNVVVVSDTEMTVSSPVATTVGIVDITVTVGCC